MKLLIGRPVTQLITEPTDRSATFISKGRNVSSGVESEALNFGDRLESSPDFIINQSAHILTSSATT
ncbi:MAG: hypothetical protein EOP06_07360 [Proteobacteria bacterium]|nr:MAG: hypothetical protein EOP06_07360 [Pseudomonadota bacterium]